MRILMASIFFLLYYNFVAQEVELKKITKEDFTDKKHHLDPMANAAVLYESGKVNINDKSGSSLKIVKRLKIYNKDGYKYATIKVPFRTKSANITSVKGHTYNLIDGKIVKEEVNDIITERTTENYNQVKFTFPNLKPGCIIEYSYTHLFYNSYAIPKWSFQDEIPVDVSTLKIYTPLNIKYTERIKGSHKINKTVDKLSKQIKYSYLAKNLPALRDEAFVNNIDNYKSSIQHELSYVISPVTGKVIKYSFNWKEAALRLQEYRAFGIEIDKENYFKTDLELLLKRNFSDEENLDLIFKYVQDRMTTNNRKGIYVSDKLKTTYKDRTGSHSEINLILTSMLREAGLESHPVLISTISHGIPNKDASLLDYNYVISSVELKNGKTILLDASNKFTRPNLLPTNCLNWYGRLIRPDGSSKQINLNPIFPSAQSVNVNIELNKDGSLKGNFERKFTKQEALNYRNRFRNSNSKRRKTKIENKYGLSILDYELKNQDSVNKPLIENFSFNKNSAVDIINDKIYLQPLLFLSMGENPFKQEKTDRDFPINFTFPRSTTIIITYSIPDNYKIENSPENLRLRLNDYNGTYNFEIKEISGASFEVKAVRKINKSIINERFYKDLKDFFSNIVNIESDKIVLSKI